MSSSTSSRTRCTPPHLCSPVWSRPASWGGRRPWESEMLGDRAVVLESRRTAATDSLVPICAMLETDRHLLGTWDETWGGAFALDGARIGNRPPVPGMEGGARDPI